MRTLTAKLSLASLPLVFMVAINYHVDPAHLFGFGSEAQVGALTAEGHAVVSPSVVETRLVQRSYVQHLRQAPDVVVLGSSRAMQIRSIAFPGMRFANSSVFGASIEDLVALVGLYDRAGRMPREIVLEVDPWLLNGQNGLVGWKVLAEEYGYMARKLGFRVRGLTRFLTPTIDKYLELASPAYFQASVPLLFTPVAAESVVEAQDLLGEDPLILADGSRIEGRVRRNRSAADVAQIARQDLAAALYVSNFTALDPLARDQFERLVRHLVNAGVRVTLALVPCHPVLYDAFKTNPAFREVALQEEYIRAFAKQSGVTVLGSYDPKVAGCSNAEFFDGWHPLEPCVNRILGSR